MARTKIKLPAHFSFQCEIPVRITDLNYGGHVGNDSILTLVHEARMQYLQRLGYTELNMEGIGMIMSDAEIEFKNELFYPETITVSVAAASISRIGFDLFYKIERCKPGVQPTLLAVVRTGMVCYDYEKKKITSLPEEAGKKLAPPTTGNH